MKEAAAREKFDCIIVGAGPGGLVAAIYLQRLQRRVLLIDGGDSRASRIPKIRNLVGYAEGISGGTRSAACASSCAPAEVRFKAGTRARRAAGARVLRARGRAPVPGPQSDSGDRHARRGARPAESARAHGPGGFSVTVRFATASIIKMRESLCWCNPTKEFARCASWPVSLPTFWSS